MTIPVKAGWFNFSGSIALLSQRLQWLGHWEEMVLDYPSLIKHTLDLVVLGDEWAAFTEDDVTARLTELGVPTDIARQCKHSLQDSIQNEVELVFGPLIADEHYAVTWYHNQAYIVHIIIEDRYFHEDF